MTKHRDNIAAVSENTNGFRYVMRKIGGRSYPFDQKLNKFVPIGRIPKIRVSTRLNKDG